MMIAAMALLLALAWGGTRYPWASPQIACSVRPACCSSRCSAGACGRRPSRTCRCRSCKPVVRMGAAASACAVGASIGLTVYLPLYFQLVHKLSVAMSGLALIPIAVMTTPGSILAGRAMSRFDHYKRVPMVCLSLAIAAAALLALRPTAPSGSSSRRSPSSAWARRRLSGVHRERPERGAAAPDGHRDRGDELLPRADARAGGRDHGRHRAGRLRRRHGARPRRRGGGEAASALGAGVSHVFG